MKFEDTKKIGIFQRLVKEDLYTVGIYFELDKHYTSPASVKAKIYAIYNEVKNNPEKFGLSQESVDLVTSAVSSRKVAMGPSLRETMEIDKTDIKSLTIGASLKMGELLNKKIDYLNRSPKALRATPLTALASTFSTLFDKSQIVKGEATENIAVLSKIDKTLSSSELIQTVLKMRELEQSKI